MRVLAWERVGLLASGPGEGKEKVGRAGLSWWASGMGFGLVSFSISFSIPNSNKFEFKFI